MAWHLDDGIFLKALQMAHEKPIREYERLVLRVPDGLRDVLARRAAGNGRSANAEAVAILSDALGSADPVAMKMLHERRQALLSQEQAIKRQLAELQDALSAVHVEISNQMHRTEG